MCKVMCGRNWNLRTVKRGKHIPIHKNIHFCQIISFTGNCYIRMCSMSRPSQLCVSFSSYKHFLTTSPSFPATHRSPLTHTSHSHSTFLNFFTLLAYTQPIIMPVMSNMYIIISKCHTRIFMCYMCFQLSLKDRVSSSVSSVIFGSRCIE